MKTRKQSNTMAKAVARMIAAEETKRDDDAPPRVSARRWVDSKTLLDDTRLIWGGPSEDATEVSTFTVWTSSCSRYRVVRKIDKYDDGEHAFHALYARPIWNGKMWDSIHCTKAGRPMAYKDILHAIQVVETFHLEKTQPEKFASAAEQFAADAKHAKLDTLPQRARVATTEEEGSAESPTPRKTKATRPPKERDRFGAKPGTRGAFIAAALTAKPLSAAELEKKANVKGPLHDPLRRLVARGVAVEIKGKFRLSDKFQTKEKS